MQDLNATAAAEEAAAVEETQDQSWEEIMEQARGETSDESRASIDFTPESDPEPEGQGEEINEEPEHVEGDGDEGTAPESENPDDKEKLRHQLASEQGRRRANQRKIRQMSRELAEARRNAPSESTDDEEAPDLSSVKEEYGDVVGPLVDEVERQNKKLAQIEANEKAAFTRKEDEYKELVAEQRTVFVEAHPDAMKYLQANSDVFEAWVEDQPKAVRDTYAENASDIIDGEAVAEIYAQFNADLTEFQNSQTTSGEPASEEASETTLQSRRRRQLAGARTTSSRTQPRTSSEPSKDDDSDAAFEWAMKEARKSVGG